MSLYIKYLKFIAKYLFKYWNLWRKWMLFLLLEPWSVTLWNHTNTQRRHKWGRDCSTSINSEYLEIHGFGSTKCFRANVRGCVGAGHFRKRWKGPADVDANLPLRDKLKQTENRTNCQNKKRSSSLCSCCVPLHVDLNSAMTRLTIQASY